MINESQLTKWYHKEVKPVRTGVYLVECPTLKAHLFALWDGQHWGCSAATIEFAIAQPDFEFASQEKTWCGLSYDPDLDAKNVQADIRINQLKNGGTLRLRDDHRALVLQIQEGGAA